MLTVEQLLPRKSRKWRTSGKKKLSPNKRDGRFKKTMKHISFFLWGGEYYGNYISLNQALHYEPVMILLFKRPSDFVVEFYFTGKKASKKFPIPVSNKNQFFAKK